jgi:hypothetical protein
MGRVEELGRTVKEEKKKGLGRLGWAAREKEKRKGKSENGPSPIRKRGRKRIAFKCI